jgi:hypothetical protein
LKAQNLFGESAKKYGTNNNKFDGAIMASTGDWRDSNCKPYNIDRPLIDMRGLDSKDRKYLDM